MSMTLKELIKESITQDAKEPEYQLSGTASKEILNNVLNSIGLKNNK